MYLALSEVHSFYLKLGCGSVSNTLAERLDLWGFGIFCLQHWCPNTPFIWRVQINVSWANNISNLQVLALEQWCSSTLLLLKYFFFLNICHVFREHNTVADCLSKEAVEPRVELPVGLLIFEEVYDGEKIFEGSIQSFSI